jgi:anti-anti-sigma factor
LLSITKQKQQNELVIGIKGTIDLTTIGQLIEEMEMELVDNSHIALDLSQVELIDSTGIGYILRTVLSNRSQKKDIRMINIPEMIEETFEIMGVNQILDMNHHV